MASPSDIVAIDFLARVPDPAKMDGFTIAEMRAALPSNSAIQTATVQAVSAALRKLHWTKDSYEGRAWRAPGRGHPEPPLKRKARVKLKGPHGRAPKEIARLAARQVSKAIIEAANDRRLTIRGRKGNKVRPANWAGLAIIREEQDAARERAVANATHSRLPICMPPNDSILPRFSLNELLTGDSQRRHSYKQEALQFLLTQGWTVVQGPVLQAPSYANIGNGDNEGEDIQVPFSPEDDAEILARRKLGLSVKEIGIRLGRHPSSVGHRLRQLVTGETNV